MNRRRIAEAAALAGALVWGGILRFGWMGVNPFAYDEARLSKLALELARMGKAPTIGMVSSVGIPNMPASVWLFAIPYAVSTSPLFAIACVAALNLAAVLVLWWIARETCGPWAGTVAAWLLAGSPYAVFYSRSIWAQDLLIPLAVLWAATGALALKKQDTVAFIVYGFLAGFVLQVHYAGYVLLTLTLLLVVLYRSRQKFLPLAAGLVASVIPAMPFLLLLFGGKIRPPSDATGNLRFGMESIKQIIAMTAGYNWDWLFLGPKWHLSTGDIAVASGGTILLLAFAGLAMMLVRVVRKKQDYLVTTVLLWALAGPMLWMFHFSKPNLHYQLVSLPAWFLAAGYAVSAMPKHNAKGIMLALTVGVSLAQGTLFARGLEIAGREATPGGISAPLKYDIHAAEAVKDGKPVIAVVPGADPRFNGDAAVIDVLLWGYPHRLVDGTCSLVLPDEATNLLFVAPWMPAWKEFENLLPGTTEAEYVPRRRGEYSYLIVRMGGKVSPAGFHRVKPVRLANGARLEGWKMHSQEDGFRFITLWRIDERPAAGEFHQFNHLYIDDGQKPLMVHDIPTSSGAWQKGDYLITWADFPPPPKGTLRMAVGMYGYPSLKRVPKEEGADPLAPTMLLLR